MMRAKLITFCALYLTLSGSNGPLFGQESTSTHLSAPTKVSTVGFTYRFPFRISPFRKKPLQDAFVFSATQQTTSPSAASTSAESISADSPHAPQSNRDISAPSPKDETKRDADSLDPIQNPFPSSDSAARQSFEPAGRLIPAMPKAIANHLANPTPPAVQPANRQSNQNFAVSDPAMLPEENQDRFASKFELSPPQDQLESIPLPFIKDLPPIEDLPSHSSKDSLEPETGNRGLQSNSQQPNGLQSQDVAPGVDPRDVQSGEQPGDGRIETLQDPRDPAITPPNRPQELINRQALPSSPYSDAIVDAEATSLWWDPLVTRAQDRTRETWNVGINDLITYFLRHSPRMRSISLVRESALPAITENHAEFDPTAFVESSFDRTNDPIGNALTTGGTGRFLDNDLSTRAGLRKKTHSGGRLEAYQELGIQTNNSDFFIPNEQGTTYLSLSFTQPLLNGRGRIYNDSLIAIAQFKADLANEVAREKIQTELLTITENYWRLYSARAALLQKQENVRRAEAIYTELHQRKEIDVSQTQLLRANAAVATRKAAVIQAENDVRNVEVELSAGLGIDSNDQIFEYVPTLAPELLFPSVDVRDAFVTALQNRPEILQASRRVRIASEQANRSRHEVLPVLDFLVSTYVFGLNENYDVGQAFGRQFSEGAPGYSAGFNFEMPIYRRAARARLMRDEAKWQAITADFEDQVLRVQADVDIAVRNVVNAYRKLKAREVATASARSEVDSQQKRLDLALGDRDGLSNALNFLLDSQDRLADQENLLAAAQADYMISWIALKRSMGTLIVGRQLAPEPEVSQPVIPQQMIPPSAVVDDAILNAPLNPNAENSETIRPMPRVQPSPEVAPEVAPTYEPDPQLNRNRVQPNGTNSPQSNPQYVHRVNSPQADRPPANLHHSNRQPPNFQSSNFQSSNFQSSNFQSSNFRNSNFRGANGTYTGVVTPPRYLRSPNYYRNQPRYPHYWQQPNAAQGNPIFGAPTSPPPRFQPARPAKTPRLPAHALNPVILQAPSAPDVD